MSDRDERNIEQTRGVFEDLGLLSADEIVARYTTLAWGYINRSETQGIEDLIARLTKEHELSPLLDVGCGTGRLLIPLSKRFQATGMDFSQPFLDTVKKVAPEIPVKWGDATKLPFEDASFNSILCVRLIQHLTDAQQAQFLEESRRVLRPGGILIVLNYNSFSLLNLYKKVSIALGSAARWPLRRWRFEIDEYHFGPELSSLFERHGFDVVEQFATTPGEPDLHRFLGWDAFVTKYLRPWAKVHYGILMLLNPLGRYWPWKWLFNRIVVVGKRR